MPLPRPRSTDLFLAVALFAVALAVRWRHLMTIPAFSDEGLEVLWAHDIARGARLPLTGYDAYDGPLFAYLTALAFRVFGSHLAVPRALAAVCGAITVPVTFALGSVMAGRLAGVLAAIVVTASPALVLYSSHYGWSNSLTPLFATATFACLSFAVTRHDRTALAAAGALAALTVQTHPLSAVAMAGAALWLWHVRRTYAWLTPRELRRPAIAFAIAYSPVLVANVVHPLIGLRVGLSRSYAVALTLRPDEYAARAADLLRTVVDALAGGLAFEHVAVPPALAAAVALVLAAAMVADWRHGSRLPVFVLGVSLIAIPFAVKLYVPRYVTFLVPLAAAVAMSSLVGLSRRRIVLAAVVTCVLAMSVAAAARTERYVRWAAERDLTNDAYFRLRGALVDRGACGPSLFLEDVGRPLVNPAWTALYAVDYVLTLSGCEHTLAHVDRISEALAAHAGAWAVLSVTTASAWPSGWTLEPAFIVGTARGQELVPIGLYRVTRVRP